MAESYAFLEFELGECVIVFARSPRPVALAADAAQTKRAFAPATILSAAARVGICEGSNFHDEVSS